MKKPATIVLVVLLAVALIIPQVLAITSQGLFYRMEDGDRFYYTMDINDEGDIWPTEIIYLEIENANKIIPEPLTNLADIDYVEVGFYFENGTGMGFTALVFLYAADLEYPVGNWSLIDTLAMTNIEGMLLGDARDVSTSFRTDYWGYSYVTNSTADTEVTVTIDYSTFDGMLSYYRVETVNTTTSELKAEYEIRRFSYHNFDWGFNDGARFDFHVSVIGEELVYSEVDEDFYLKVDEDGLYVIPYLMDEWDDVPFIGADIYWTNDTISYDSFLGHSWRLAVPLGNWSLLDSFIEDMSPAVNITVDSLGSWFWGYTRDEMIGDVLLEVHTDYLKTDGFLAHHSVVFTNTTTSEEIGTITVIRAGLETYDDSTAPVLNHPNNMEFAEGTANQNITWTPTDDYPDNFEISVNGVVVDLGSWASITSIVLDLGVFNEGVYNCSLIVYDIAGNYAVDSVLVNVTAAPATTSGITDLIMDNILYVAIGVGAVVLLGAVVCMRRKS